MASSTTNPSAPNLATMLSVRRKMAARNTAGSDPRQTPPSRPAVANAHSNERIAYHQDTTAIIPPQITPTTVPENATDQPKISRKTKQLEVGLLDMKMEEINRKQTEKTNEALDTWKGFDSVNYGFNSTPGAGNTTPAPPPITKQRTPTPPQKQTSPDKQPSPIKEHPPTEESVPTKQPPTAQQQSPAEESTPAQQQSPIKQRSSVRQTSPARQQPKAETSEPVKEKSPVRQQPKAEEPAPVKQQPPKREPSPKQTESPVKHQPKSEPPPPSQEKGNPPPQETVEKEPSPKKQPVAERRSLSSSPPPLPEEKPLDKQSAHPQIILSQRSRMKSPEQERPRSVPPRSPTPVIENIIPISSITSDPQIFQKNAQPNEKPPTPTSNNHQFKPFPDIKNYEVRKSRHALKSIQRSMDRYRFHVW